LAIVRRPSGFNFAHSKHPLAFMADNVKVWLVTGTSTGIGRAIVERLGQQQQLVVATARTLANIADYPARLGNQVLCLAQDVNNAADNQRVVEQTLQTFGRIDVLVNNAGYGLEGATEELTMEQIRAQMETNVFGLIDMTKQVLPHMRQQQSGFIVNVASIAGLRGYNGLGIYNASKFAVVGFSEALRQEVRPFGIRVACVEPGPYKTDWAGRSIHRSQAMDTQNAQSPYSKLNETLLRAIDGMSGAQPGNPTQIADVLISAAYAPEVPLHMIFGDEAIQVWKDKLERYQDPTYMDYFPHSRNQL
jgi:NAD(P)-dependent dehydrogenase (short-subunit alcohol dehydrogenase family)